MSDIITQDRGAASSIEHLIIRDPEDNFQYVNRRERQVAEISAEPRIKGHITIRDIESGEVLVDKDNAIHYEHLSVAIAKSLSNEPTGRIFEMHFGNGGSMVSGTGTVTYFPPNVTGADADLYNPTYYKVVDTTSSANTDITKNFMEINHVTGTTFTDIIITCTLNYNEPADQQPFDDATDVNQKYIFDELGLKAYSPISGQGPLLTHVIFHPVMKAANRLIEIVYTLRISMA